MNRKFNFRLLSIFLCFVLLAAAAFTLTGCQNKTPETSSESSVATAKFTLVVVDAQGKETKFDITTSEKTVADALLKEKLVEGDDGEYGLYIKKVNGIEADYEKDKTYWAFYIGGEYAMTGVSQTDVVDGETYTLKVERG